MDANAKPYLIEFGGATATYSALVPSSMWILHGHEHTALGCSIALMPTIPSAFALLALLRFLVSWVAPRLIALRGVGVGIAKPRYG
jgi:hypothetical protein